jgi:SAM-dependent methyltransferase
MLNMNFLNFSNNINLSRYAVKNNRPNYAETISPEVKPVMSIYASNNNLSFASWHKVSITKDLAGIEKKYNHHTFFFRDFETIEFLKQYLNVYFPNGTHIANFGCSNGEETRTIAMIIDNPEYKITGFDIVKEAVDLANEGEYLIHRICGGPFTSDEHLIDKKIYSDEIRKDKNKTLIENYWKKFDYYFNNLGNTTKFDYRLHCPTPAISYKANDVKFNKIITGFQVGDICNFNPDELKRQNTGVIVFKNAWYHLHSLLENTIDSDIERIDLKKIEMVVRNIHETLPKNGLLVCGSLNHDHLVNYKYTLVTSKKNIFNDTPFHKILKDAGFKPVFYDTSELEYGFTLTVPSVWKKV